MQTVTLNPTSVLSGVAVSLNEIKIALRLPTDLTDEDSFLTTAINAAESFIDRMCNVHLRSRSVSAILSRFEDVTTVGLKRYAWLKLNVYPVTAITITYKDISNITQTVAAEDIQILNDGLLPTLLIANADTLNNYLYQSHPYPISITGTAGFSQLPSEAEQAIKQIVGFMYQNREVVADHDKLGSSFSQNPHILALQRKPY